MLTHHPNEIILGVASHLSAAELNALIQTAHRFHNLLLQELYDRAPTLIRSDGDTPLIWAARRGRTTCVQKLLERDPDPIKPSKSRDTTTTHDATAAEPMQSWTWRCALEEAVMHSYSSITKLLLQAGARVTQDPDHPAAPMIHETINAMLCLASYQGQCEMITLLLEFGADAHLLRFGPRLPLHIAASHGHLDAVRLLLQSGADIASVDEQGDAAIHHAAAGGWVEVVRFLLDQGVPVDMRGDGETTVLLTAVIYRRPAVMRVLLEAGADVSAREGDGNNALHLAAFFGTVEMVELLLSYGAGVDVQGPNGRTVLHLAAAGVNPEVVSSLCRAGVAINALDASGTTALHLAAMHGRTEFARLLLEMGADLSAAPGDGQTALHLAAWTGQADLVQLLVDAGAAVGALHRSGGHTALHYAAVQGSVDVFRVLVHAAEAQQLDWLSSCWCGSTVLSKAAGNGHLGILELMVERGVDVTVCRDGSSALHAAAAAGQTDLVEFLLSVGADRLQLDYFGRSAIDWAARDPPTQKLLGDAPPSAPLVDEEKRTAALKKGIAMLATRALTEEKSAAYRLGKCLLYMNDGSAARVAFMYDATVDPNVPDSGRAVCDLCQETPALTDGRFVCQTCPDVDLCSRCVDRYYRERLQVRLCEGQQFFEVQASSEELLAIQPNEYRLSWLRGLVAKYST